jgi:hypothetical protein
MIGQGASRLAWRRAPEALLAAAVLRSIGGRARARGAVAFVRCGVGVEAFLVERATDRAAARRSARNAAAVARAARARLELTLASASSKISAFDALRRGGTLTVPRARATSTCSATSRR